MNKIKRKKKLIHEGKYVAEVDVQVVVDDTEWTPYLSLEDAYKLDDIRDALKRGDIKEASKQARVYELHPVAV
ncbi:hypothetical protein [methane-oxidizing endosymbiont of Gigantopelta aegis]|uniref:hypothetical protein n=1 Tax=methane-oxidizing endosymbiont of Gigantopelta aegis TaxID=2794938 RepID=UPI0018DEAA07|nr:hypothetical protein [methane-oxidizing endosymbiont of Gigantopelta aegis]